VKLSVSVPDELWERAQRALGEEGPSQIVQEALRRLTGPDAAASSFSDLFEDSVSDSGQSRIERIRDRMLQQAQETWQRGYDDGLALAEQVSWDALESFGDRANFDVARWLWNINAPQTEAQAIFDTLAAFHADGSLLVDPDGDPVLRRLQRPYREGFEKALSDVWRAVAEATIPDAEPVSPPEDDDIPF
jgi:hypothetical protein